MSIYATLHTTPTNSGPVHEMIYITRGASAELIYPLYDKVFRFEDIEQVTFTFKQGKNLQWYTMFAADGTTDSHFYHFDNEDYAAIIFNLDSEETKQFKPGLPLEYEVAVKLNTDSLVNLGGKDSIIIEPQHYIEVRDSLFSRI
jgi:hypothetical protein